MIGGLDPYGFTFWYDIGGGKQLLDKAFAQAYPNVVIIPEIPAMMSGPEVWGHFTVPVRSLDDMQGLKMRAFGDGVEVLRRMGVATVNMPGGEVYEAIQRGVLDGCEIAVPAVDWDMGFQEVTRYMSISSSRAPTDAHFNWVHKDDWNSLPPDLQEIMLSVGRANMWWGVAQLVDQNAAAMQKFRDFGVEISKVPPDVERALAEAAKEFYDEQAAGDAFYAEVLQSQRDFQVLYVGWMGLNTPVLE
jgi:TRAP-type mannitol/chloroaromatic compound transport system substrate-binding protein